MLSVSVILQALIPITLLARVFQARRHSLAAWILFTSGAIAYLAAIAISGVWLFVPWYAPFVYFLLLAFAIVRHATGVRRVRWMPVERFGRLEMAMAMAMCAAAGTFLFEAIDGRRAPRQEVVNLAFPLDGGSYYVANGGSSALLNAHVRTLADERFRAYRGESYATDIVRIGDHDLRAAGVAPADPARYASFGEPVYSPCGGVVVRAQGGAPDLRPPAADRDHPAGNFIMIDCGTAYVVLAHFRQGSLRVQAGDTVARGQQVAEIGNSGNTGEPHLHVHAQRAAVDPDFMAGDPLPVKFDGRFLARNDIVRANRSGALTETGMLYAEVGSTIVALVMLIVSLRSVRAARLLFVALFAWAAMVNMRTAFEQPTAYLGYAWLTVSALYRSFILGWFAGHVTLFVAAIAAGQALIAALLLTARTRAERAGLLGAIVFLIAIAPLGAGAGFPATIVMALAAATMLRDIPSAVSGRVAGTPSRVEPPTSLRAA